MTQHRAEGGGFAGLQRQEGMDAGGLKESRGQEEPRTSHLKGNGAGCLFDSPALLTPFTNPSCLWRNQLCPQMRSSSHSPFHWIDCPQGHLRPR